MFQRKMLISQLKKTRTSGEKKAVKVLFNAPVKDDVFLGSVSTW